MDRANSKAGLASYQRLLCAILENAMQESAKLRRLGFWEDDPAEMCLLSSDDFSEVDSRLVCQMLDERMFWGGETCQVLLDVVGSVTSLSVSREQLICGIVNFAEGRESMCKRRGGSGGSINI